MTQDLYLALILFVFFLNPVAKISSFQVHQDMTSSFSDLSQLIVGTLKDDGSKLAGHYAVYRADSPPNNGYTGGMATLDVYNYPYMKKGEVTAAMMWVANEQNDKGADENNMEVGWAVDPLSYEDNKTHFFVSWKVRSKVCFNLNCNGFVPVNSAPITPGDPLESAKGKTKITFKIFRSQDDGDWWLHFGYDINNMKPVGFWPKSTFTSLGDNAERITWGGFAGCSNGNPTPPMGNGQWPGERSASFHNVQLVDGNGQGYSMPAQALHEVVTDKNCYRVSTFLDGMFYYGGPGSCSPH